jgi:hypothetical protein
MSLYKDQATNYETPHFVIVSSNYPQHPVFKKHTCITTDFGILEMGGGRYVRLNVIL